MVTLIPAVPPVPVPELISTLNMAPGIVNGLMLIVCVPLAEMVPIVVGPLATLTPASLLYWIWILAVGDVTPATVTTIATFAETRIG